MPQVAVAAQQQINDRDHDRVAQKSEITALRIRKIEGEPEKRLEAILRQLTDSDKDQFMKAFWLELVTMKKEKQQVLTEFLLEWLWVACGKEQAMERIRYWASSYCLPFA